MQSTHYAYYHRFDFEFCSLFIIWSELFLGKFICYKHDCIGKDRSDSTRCKTFPKAHRAIISVNWFTTFYHAAIGNWYRTQFVLSKFDSFSRLQSCFNEILRIRKEPAKVACYATGHKGIHWPKLFLIDSFKSCYWFLG